MYFSSLVGQEMINNHFLDDSHFLVSINHDFVSTTKDCLAMICEALGELVSDH
jgi:hypothetical protein